MRIQLHHALLGCILICSLLLGIVGFFFLPEQIPLWYSLAIPEQQLDQKLFIILFPASIGGIVVLHTLLAKRITKIDPQLTTIFLYSTLIPSIILLIAQLRILLLIL